MVRAGRAAAGRRAGDASIWMEVLASYSAGGQKLSAAPPSAGKWDNGIKVIGWVHEGKRGGGIYII